MDPELRSCKNYVMGSVLAQPELAKMKTPEQDQGMAGTTDMGGRTPNSSIMSRESPAGLPPPVSPKDTWPDTKTYKSPAEQVGDWTQGRSEQLDDDHSKDSQLESRQNSALCEIKIQLTLSTLAVDTPKKTLLNTMSTAHPLAMSPLPPVPLLSKVPKRPARPPSLRLSSFARKRELTTSRVFVLNLEQQRTSSSYQVQPHTGYSGSYRTKHGCGKHAATELIPQPSEDPRDPLNWPTWRKELLLYSLLVTVLLCNVMKTALISVNHVLTERLMVSYVAVSALTGVPLMLSAVTGLVSGTASKVWGRRPVYLSSALFIFIGVVWNTKTSTSYAQFMAARVFQGLGWGAFDTMLTASIMDMYFEHERSIKVTVYQIVSVASTWGPPIIGGVTSQTDLGPNLQFKILAIFQIVSIPLLLLGAPESMYNRAEMLLDRPMPGWTPQTGWSSLGLKTSSHVQRLPAWFRGRAINIDRVIDYIKEVGPPQSYSSAPEAVVDLAFLLQAPSALISPTTILALLASFLPYSLLWGFSSSLSGLFARNPFDLFPATVGSLLVTPFILSTAIVALFPLSHEWSKITKFFTTKSTHMLVLAGGALLSFIGILVFSLYVSARLVDGTQGIRFSAISFVLGLLSAGSYILDAPRTTLILQSVGFTSRNLTTSLRVEADMDAGVTIWRSLFAGIFVMGIPAAVVVNSAGLKKTGIAVAVVQLFLAGAVGAVCYMFDESIQALDGRVLARVDLAFPKALRSYFDLND